MFHRVHIQHFSEFIFCLYSELLQCRMSTNPIRQFFRIVHCILCPDTHCWRTHLVLSPAIVHDTSRQGVRPLSHWRSILKFINIFYKKISSMNSQLSKEINFELLFRSLKHVLFCEILWQKFHLWSTLIGQSPSVYKHWMKRRRCCLHMAFESLFPMWTSSVLIEKFRNFLFEIGFRN